MIARLHRVNRRHLDVLTGELGILQHAVGSQPDPAHGYCVDDVARALEVDLLHARVLGWPAVSESAWRSLRFIEAAFDEPSARFRNFRSIDGSWTGGLGSDDSLGRAMLALGQAVAAAPDAELVERAGALFGRAFPAASRVASPRAQASVILGCAAVSAASPPAHPRKRNAPEFGPTALMRNLATNLHARWIAFARPGWPWAEETLTYENAVVPRAMIVAGRATGASTMLAIGLQVLDWLILVQTAPDGHLSPIGNGWWPRGGIRSRFDQQPIEATALMLAAEAALAATGKARYRAAMEAAYGWFLGANDLGRRVAEPARGACRDGLTASGLNTNEGAESTLMWLIAAEHIRLLRGEAAPRGLGDGKSIALGSPRGPVASASPTLGVLAPTGR
ncbi:MAG TPA: hypothetical protein VFP19_09395 [Candidatus Limnocylindrales bacterium]|nr:hypothetical protein [Candidatus Limnocylindrales bacterium]